MYSSAYEHCFPLLMDIEGGLTDHPGDPGGQTKYGISRLAYPEEDIENLTPERAKFLIHRDYWTAIRGDAINDRAIAFEILETAFILDPPGHPIRAAKIAQGALILFGVNVTYDGLIGPETIAALNAYRHKRDLIKLMNGLQLLALIFGARAETKIIDLVRKRLRHLQTFLRGWLRRIAL